MWKENKDLRLYFQDSIKTHNNKNIYFGGKNYGTRFSTYFRNAC